MTTAIAMDIARPPAAAARLPGSFRASSRRVAFRDAAPPRVSIFLDVPPDAPFAWSSSAAASAASPPVSRFVALASTRTSTSATELSRCGTGIALWPNGPALRCIGPDVEREVASRGRAISGMRGVVDDTQPQNQPESPSSRPNPRRRRLPAGAAFPRVMCARHGAGLVCVRWAGDARAASFFRRAPSTSTHPSTPSTPSVSPTGRGRSVRLRATRRIGRHRRRPRLCRRAAAPTASTRRPSGSSTTGRPR